jgi:carboxymethylenebutenolidase
MALRDYLATEVALDHSEGLLTRREALQRLGRLGLSVAAATGLLTACGSSETPAAPPSPGPSAPPTTATVG